MLYFFVDLQERFFKAMVPISIPELQTVRSTFPVKGDDGKHVVGVQLPPETSSPGRDGTGCWINMLETLGTTEEQTSRFVHVTKNYSTYCLKPRSRTFPQHSGLTTNLSHGWSLIQFLQNGATKSITTPLWTGC